MASSLLTPPDQINCGVKPALARVIEHLYDHARFYRALQAPLENKWIDLLGKHSCSRRNQPRQEVARVANFPKELPNDERAFTCGQLLDNLLVSQMIGPLRTVNFTGLSSLIAPSLSFSTRAPIVRLKHEVAVRDHAYPNPRPDR